jgi:hypothetical protein
MGDQSTETGGSQSRDVLDAIFNNYPSIYQTLLGQVLPTERTTYGARHELAPKYANLANRLEGIASRGELNRLKGVGAESWRQAESLARESDPEYYATRANIAAKLEELMNTGLTSNEVEGISRGMARQNIATGSQYNPSNQSTISNAMTFGNAARDRLGSALGSAIGSMSGMRTTDAGTIFNTASGRARGISAGWSNPGMVSSDTAMGLGGNYLGNQMQLESKSAEMQGNVDSSLDEVAQGIGMIGIGNGGK